MVTVAHVHFRTHSHNSKVIVNFKPTTHQPRLRNVPLCLPKFLRYGSRFQQFFYSSADIFSHYEYIHPMYSQIRLVSQKTAQKVAFGLFFIRAPKVSTSLHYIRWK